jgi:hypothetical protein
LTYSLGEEERSMLEYNLRARTALNRYFTGWIEHHAKQKEKWSSLIKYRYLLSRMRLNKMFWSWKLQVRQKKVNRLKSSIIEHTHYQHQMRACFRGWREANKNEREGARRLEEIGGKRMKRVVLQYMRYLVRDKGLKMKNIEVA